MTGQNKPWLSEHFDANCLPTPVDYYSSYCCDCLRNCNCSQKWQDYISNYPEREWFSIYCPFHNDDKPSMRVNVVYGAFKCMACGVKGRDVLSFHRQLKKLTFIEAVRDLGAWRN